MPRKDSLGGTKKPYRTRNVQPKHHDTYARKAKSPDSIVCDDCNLLLRDGRWYRGAPPFGEVRGGLCPACARIRDHYPAGTIHVPRAMITNREDLVSLILGVEEVEQTEHPLERVMEIGEDDEGLVVTTTGTHLARRVAGRLKRQFHKNPKIHYGEENVVQISWG